MRSSIPTPKNLSNDELCARKEALKGALQATDKEALNDSNLEVELMLLEAELTHRQLKILSESTEGAKAV